jgi:prolyl 4-hydroxylase
MTSYFPVVPTTAPALTAPPAPAPTYTVTPLGEEIFLVNDLLSPALCQQLIQLTQACEHQGQLKAADILIETVDNQIRSSDLLRLGRSHKSQLGKSHKSQLGKSHKSHKSYKSHKSQQGDDPQLETANQLLLEQFAVIKQMLLQVYGVRFPYAEPCTILRYRPQQFYKRHIDNILLGSRFEELEQNLPTRDISLVGYLNDDFVGGETYFDRQDVKVKPQAGAVLVFPAYFTHPHASLPVLEGEKYAFTSWLFH